MGCHRCSDPSKPMTKPYHRGRAPKCRHAFLVNDADRLGAEDPDFIHQPSVMPP